jgi:hypothetical protein
MGRLGHQALYSGVLFPSAYFDDVLHLINHKMNFIFSAIKMGRNLDASCVGYLRYLSRFL